MGMYAVASSFGLTQTVFESLEVLFRFLDIGWCNTCCSCWWSWC